MNRKTLVILAGAVMFIALFALTFAPVQQVAAQGPTATPVPPVAKLKVVGIPANANLPGAITATLSYVTSTAVGTAKTTVALGTSGLSNIPVNVPVVLQVTAVDPKDTGNAVWTLTKPAESKATITGTTSARFTPDVAGAYMVSVQLRGATGNSNTEYTFFNAGTFIGVEAGGCKTCHPAKVTEWAKTGHASIFTREVDNKDDPSVESHYTENCTRCHTVGFFLPAAGNGGYSDAKAKTNWTFPTWDKINAAGKKTGPSNFDTAPAEVKNMGNIQCENCHGPANEHVKNGANVMAVSFKNDSCNACHAGGGTHVKGLEIANSKHTTGSSFEEITGPAEQACQRCHSGAGFASFLKTPTNPAAWENEESYVGCAACHDPHSDANYAQLRVVGKPVQVPFKDAKDVGLSGICETCHNNRSIGGDEYAKAAPGAGTPHYSSAAEMLSDLGGTTYGQTVPNSPHGMMVGAAPVPNPTTAGTFLWSASTDKKGNVPGPCVACHMYPGVSTAGDPLQYKVGNHSFNTVTPDGKTNYGAACKSCHGEVKDFNLKAKADYDGNGKAEGVQDEVKGLLNATWKALEAKGFKKQQSGYPYATTPAGADFTPSLKGAWYNFRYVYGVMWSSTSEGGEGKAAAVHNFKRSCALLQLSLKDLGATPAGAADCTK